MFSFTAIQNWNIADKYSVVFSNSNVNGIFKKLTGTIAFDAANPAQSKFDIAIDVASINTGNALQNKHAKEAEWFDATKYPQIKFTSSKIVKSGAGFTATGTLEIKGVKKEVSLPFTFKAAGNAGTFAGSFSINRSDFNVGKKGGEVDEAVKIEVTIPVVK
ncbi:signal peptide protein [Filimonas lacunae]|nr:signal peptide protein [Filimonas lacunae]